MAPYLTNLRRRSAEASDERSRACTEAEAAAYLARSGEVREAAEQISHLRSRFGDGQSPRILAWICFAEAMLAQFSAMTGRCRERLQRARAFARAATDTRLQALSAAWLGYDAFNHHQHKAMAEHLREALTLCPPDDATVMFRVYSVLSAARVAGRDLTRFELDFRRAHEAVLIAGDRAGLAAIIANRGAMLASWLRVDHAFTPGSAPPRLVQFARNEIETGIYYKQLARLRAFEHFGPLWRGWMLAIEGKHPQALDLFTAHLKPALEKGLHRMEQTLRSDIAWSLHSLGRGREAKEVISQLLPLDQTEMDFDDRAVLNLRLGQLSRFYEVSTDPSRFTTEAARFQALFASEQQELSLVLNEFV
jgi:hypothetical protein